MLPKDYLLKKYFDYQGLHWANTEIMLIDMNSFPEITDRFIYNKATLTRHVRQLCFQDSDVGYVNVEERA